MLAERPVRASADPLVAILRRQEADYPATNPAGEEERNTGAPASAGGNIRCALLKDAIRSDDGEMFGSMLQTNLRITITKLTVDGIGEVQPGPSTAVIQFSGIKRAEGRSSTVTAVFGESGGFAMADAREKNAESG
ncbi:MAG: hypothetical protein M1354_04205 [Candidatus Marsarchaeota archaeon]|nr:hypothetical protein [Candidatus Marsarchaeota archaeon]